MTIMGPHPFSASLDPRHGGACVKCGKGRSVHPTVRSVPDYRNPVVETERMLAAGRAKGVDARGLDSFAIARTHPGPVTGGLRRNLVTEALEELADCRNYILWDWERNGSQGELTPAQTWNYMEALGALAVAWHRWDRRGEVW